MLITAVSRGGVVGQDVMGYFVVNLMSAPAKLCINFGGILTGLRKLACVSLIKTNSKARIKPLCYWDFLWSI